MPILRPLVLGLFLLQFPPPALDTAHHPAPDWLSAEHDSAARLIGEAVSSDAAWQRLAYLGDTFGNRSQRLARTWRRRFAGRSMR